MVTVQIVERPAFYSELEFYEWNLCGETEPFDRGRGEWGEKKRADVFQFNNEILQMFEQKHERRFHCHLYYSLTYSK